LKKNKNLTKKRTQTGSLRGGEPPHLELYPRKVHHPARFQERKRKRNPETLWIIQQEGEGGITDTADVGGGETLFAIQ